MKTKRIRKIFYYSATFIILLLILYFINNIYLDNYYLEQYNKVNENISLVTNENTTISNEYYSNNIEQELTLDDYRQKYNNKDIVSTLSILNTDFKLLLVQTNNNDYYLNHLINKEKNKFGSTFIDYRVNLENSKKINIYGHNNGSNSLSFNYLINYLDKSYYDKYNLFQIQTDNIVETYEIFSVQIVSNNKHMQISFTDSEWNSYINEIINNSIYNTNTSINDINKMITLQTCTNNVDNEFLLIHGRKIEN